jgi:hypothetical protein
VDIAVGMGRQIVIVAAMTGGRESVLAKTMSRPLAESL